MFGRTCAGVSQSQEGERVEGPRKRRERGSQAVSGLQAGVEQKGEERSEMSIRTLKIKNKIGVVGDEEGRSRGNPGSQGSVVGIDTSELEDQKVVEGR